MPIKLQQHQTTQRRKATVLKHCVVTNASLQHNCHADSCPLTWCPWLAKQCPRPWKWHTKPQSGPAAFSHSASQRLITSPSTACTRVEHRSCQLGATRCVWLWQLNNSPLAGLWLITGHSRVVPQFVPQSDLPHKSLWTARPWITVIHAQQELDYMQAAAAAVASCWQADLCRCQCSVWQLRLQYLVW